MAVQWRKLQVHAARVILFLAVVLAGDKAETGIRVSRGEKSQRTPAAPELTPEINSSSGDPLGQVIRVWRTEEGEEDFGYLRKKKKDQLLGCARNPMMCLERRFRPAGPICCGWLCVDVTRDVNHCGHCFHQCKYSRHCCHGRCKNLDRDVHNCGVCGRRCPKRTKCVFGLCGYA